MNAIIKKILLFGDGNEKREVSLTPGLNIITGDSKTGKSAIIEIIDYCLFASRSTIPKGIIDKFTQLYAIVLKVEEKYISIGRIKPSDVDSNKVYFKVETDTSFLEDINKEYFTNSTLKLLKEGQAELERHLGLSVLDTRPDNESEKTKYGKASLRSFVSFLFQHQNLIANKHSMFYRFDDSYKRRKTIDDLPILLGWETGEYFSILRELHEKKTKLKDEISLVKRLKIQDEEMLNRLDSILEPYYSLLGKELPVNPTLRELKTLSRNLPDIDIYSYSNTNVQEKIDEKNSQRRKLYVELSENKKLLSELEENTLISNGYQGQLTKLQAFSKEFDQDNEALTCPVCSNHVNEINETLNLVKLSREKLMLEVSKVGNYKRDNSELIEELRQERDSIKKRIKILSIEIESLEKQDEEFNKNNALRDQAFLYKGVTEANVKMLFEHNRLSESSTDIEELQEEIKRLEKRLEGFDIQSKINEAESFLTAKMKEISDVMDFEDELKPGVFRFKFENFDFYYQFNEKEKIQLSEMGSGANWLTSHLAFFVSFLHLNCASKKSVIPTFLILDQPSQIYFPKTYGESEDSKEDIRQVKNIIEVLRNQIEIIKTDTGIEPQIIIMDHADEKEFEPNVRYRWKRDGAKLI